MMIQFHLSSNQGQTGRIKKKKSLVRVTMALYEGLAVLTLAHRFSCPGILALAPAAFCP